MPSASAITRFYRVASIILAMTCVLAWALGSASNEPGRPRKHLTYLGQATLDIDQGFKSFSTAVARHLARYNVAFDVEVHHELASTELFRRLESVKQGERQVFVAPTTYSARDVMKAAPAASVVFYSAANPLTSGLVKSLHAPGGHASGVALFDTLDEKRLETLLVAYPSIRHVAVLADRDWLERPDNHAAMKVLRQKFAFRISELQADSAEHLLSLLKTFDLQSIDAWYVPISKLTVDHLPVTVGALLQTRRPAMFSTTEPVRLGAALSLAQDTSFVWDALAEMAVRVLAGEDPANLPVERPRRFVLSVRPGVSSDLGPLSAEVVRRADRVY